MLKINQKSNNTAKKLSTHLITIAIACLLLTPLVLMIITSLKSSEQIYNPSAGIIPDPFVWTNYFEAISKIKFFQSFFNTFVIAIFNIIGVIFSSALAAYAFSVLEWKNRDFFFALTLATMMLPEMALMVPQFLVFKELGLYGGFLPLIIPYFAGLPFYIFLYRQFFLSIPFELIESARIDGATEQQIWWRIMMPLSKPISLVVALFQFLICWNDLMKPSIYLIDEQNYTLSLALQQYQSRLGGAEWGPLMGASVIMVVPVVILFFFTQKSFVRGVIVSGMKE